MVYADRAGDESGFASIKTNTKFDLTGCGGIRLRYMGRPILLMQLLIEAVALNVARAFFCADNELSIYCVQVER